MWPLRFPLRHENSGYRGELLHVQISEVVGALVMVRNWFVEIAFFVKPLVFTISGSLNQLLI